MCVPSSNMQQCHIYPSGSSQHSMTSFFFTCQRHRIPGTKADKGACTGAPGRAKTAELAVWPRRVHSVLEPGPPRAPVGPGSSDCRLLSAPLQQATHQQPERFLPSTTCHTRTQPRFHARSCQSSFPRPFPMPGVIMPSTAPATSPKAGFASPSGQPYCWYCHRCHMALFPTIPQPPGLLDDWISDPDFLDNRRSVGKVANLTLPLHIASTFCVLGKRTRSCKLGGQVTAPFHVLVSELEQLLVKMDCTCQRSTLL